MQDMSETSDDQSDASLLNRLLVHDQSAWRDLVARYAPLLHAIACRTCRNYGHRPTTAEIEDMVAEVWVNLLENEMHLIRQMIEHGKVLPTLHVLTRHRTIDALRRRRKIPIPVEDIVQLTNARTGSDYRGAYRSDNNGDDDTPEPMTAAEFSMLKQAVDALTDRQRTVLRLTYLHGRKHREIAELTGMPQNSVGPTLHRAIQRLRAAATANSNSNSNSNSAQENAPRPQPPVSDRRRHQLTRSQVESAGR